jgi:hypothetical protein
MGCPAPASGVSLFLLNWIKLRFLSGGGGERFGRGGLKRKGGGGVSRGEWRLAEPFDVRFISSQPLFIGLPTPWSGALGKEEEEERDCVSVWSLLLSEAYGEEGELS